MNNQTEPASDSFASSATVECPAAANQGSERALFEAWAEANQFCIHRNDSDKYRDYHRATTRFAWDGWQARALLHSQKNIEVLGTEPVRWLLEYTFNGEEKGSTVYESEAECRRSAATDGGVCVPLVRSTYAEK